MTLHRMHILVSMDAHTIAQGARNVKETLLKMVKVAGLSNEIKVVETGSLGIANQGVVLVVYPEGIYYANVKVEDVPDIVEDHLLKGRHVERLVYREPVAEPGAPMKPLPSRVQKQQRIVLKNAGTIDPDSIEEYIARDGYEALAKVLTTMKQEAVIEEVKNSKLVGRGGAAFPCGLKWSFAAKEKSDIKYVICNADEGEPGTFKDRLILEGDPHAIIEAMTIVAYAVGATEGYIYIRGEYRQSIEKTQRAIEKAREMNLLGTNIFESGFNFDLHIREGAGAYVCGEETALIESIEGKRGEPRDKPPYPPQAGLWGKPTVVNNVETLANIPQIILNGAEWFRNIGTETCTGTKVFLLVGNINSPGLIEVPMGITLREVIYDIGLGIPDGKSFLLAQTGGTTGGILTESELDVPMAYDTLPAYDSGLGSGALLIVDDSHDVVKLVRNFVEFFNHESCGKCTLCREGTGRLLELLNKIIDGKGTASDIDLIEKLSRTMKHGAFCGLGQAAPTPILGSLKHFKNEYLKYVTSNANRAAA
ncbi:NADH-quinone oxidoreductase subunit NuoF [candidate division KSB1 bacterium]|nr:NADH-quinone oxidoreductase subunit NuoF [candidate division KSB1 bacterium]